MTRFICLLFLLLSSSLALASYVVRGQINMKGEWQQQIYLATIDRLDDYYSANAEFIINAAAIDEDGNFELKGDNLPENAQFYRLYLLKEEHSEFNACLFVGGEEHNYIHVLLDNNSNLEILADMQTFAPFGDYTVKGEQQHRLMRELGKLLHPSYLFYEIKFPSELRFSQDKLNRDLFHFADTCSHTLVSLAAIKNTDFDGYFDTKREQYLQLGEDLKTELPEHPYTTDYFRKMCYHDPSIAGNNSYFFPILSLLFGLIIGYLWYQNGQLREQIQSQKVEETPAEDFQFTPQEVKILQLIKEGKSNKEIANELFIEVSTVKSHINKLYAKFKVKNRKEAITKAKTLELQGL